MQIVIEIPDDEYELIVGSEDCGLHILTRAVAHGIPLDKHDEEVIKDTVASIWGEPCEDCISRADVYSLLDSIDHVPQWVIDKFTELPSVTPKQKVGRWHTIQLHNIEDSIEIEEWQECSCSSCGRLHITPHNSWDYSFQFFGYCPYCGAKMEVRK